MNNNTPKFADVIIDISHEKVDRPFQYLIPESMLSEVKPGVKVKVPFGRGNTCRSGYVIDISEETDYPIEKIKSILEVDSKAQNAESDAIELAYWIKSHYGSTMIAALKTVLPIKQKMKQPEKKKIVRMVSSEETVKACNDCRAKHQVAKARVLEALVLEEELPYELVRDKLHVSKQTLDSLEKQELIKVEAESYYRNPVKMVSRSETRNELSISQKSVIDGVMNTHPSVSLLHGITGSGKTEVYLGIIEEMIKQGKQAIVLIPEIALTYQTLLRFYKRFGDRVSVVNSTLTPGEKYDQMTRAKNNELDVIIGPRSALFTPFPNLGVIIIDEEHENTYKSEQSPKYHARETAIEIARMHGASVVLGSATPSLESYYRAKKGEYHLYELSERLTGGELPTVYTVDLREELKQGNKSIFSEKLKELMLDRLSRGEQIMLFLNRRGYAGFVSCRTCGHVVKCPHCDVSLSEHRGGIMKCHYCGYETSKPTVCPECGSKYIAGFKAGTQQIEDAVKREFPGCMILRMDADTTKDRDNYEQILSAFAEGRADILIGTQMIVKGHDFPNVTLVGILAADLSLNQNDYRASERTFELLTQAAGRAGRGMKKGEVVIQTYQPEHYSIVHSQNQDYLGFYEEEIVYRDLLGYPPVSHMLGILLVTDSEEQGDNLIKEIAKTVKSCMPDQLTVIGPSLALIGKVNDKFRHVLYLKHADYEYLVEIKDRVEKYMRGIEDNRFLLQFDFDPMNIY